MENLESIKEEILRCTKCELYKTKTNFVPGTGNEKAEAFFVGEAPGREEDLKGEPFVGNAGKLLTEMISLMGLSREDVFITNVLKCRPPNNRDPLPEEVNACGSYLLRQLEVVKPNVIVCLGRHSAKFIFETFGLNFSSITKLQGKVFEVSAWGKNVKIVPLYHPAAILYKPQLRNEYEKGFRQLASLFKRRQKSLLDF
ncbi:MAG: type-4 uracil-DNA glycosylase [Archaeoglobaceae archaeon]